MNLAATRGGHIGLYTLAQALRDRQDCVCFTDFLLTEFGDESFKLTLNLANNGRLKPRRNIELPASPTFGDFYVARPSAIDSAELWL